MSAIIFPGQGSQYKGMGSDLFKLYSKLAEEASGILGYSIEELCLRDPENKLTLTQYSQPALFFVNALMFLNQKDKLGNIDYVLGHSLGEYNALFAAGIFDLLTGLRLVKKRGEIMGKAREGGMLAILGKTLSEVESILQDSQWSDIDIANHNTPTQLVLSGPKVVIEQFSKFSESRGIKSIPLRVSGAFHSRYMRESELEYRTFLENFHFHPPKIPIISNFTGRIYDPSKIGYHLEKQISNRVRWVECVEFLLNQGITEFNEIGSTILNKMVSEIKSTFKTVSHTTPVSQAVQKTKETLSPRTLGSQSFREELGVKYNYVTGSMYRGIASSQLVVRMAKQGFMSFFGSGGLSLKAVEENIREIKTQLKDEEPFGVNLLCSYMEPESELELIDLLIRNNVKVIEASAFLSITPALAYYLAKGVYQDEKTGQIRTRHHIFAKISRPEIAKIFLSPPPDRVLQQLQESKRITQREAELAKKLPVSQYLCVEADSGGHTDQGSLLTLLPAILKLRDSMVQPYDGKLHIHVGAAGGIGTPDTIAAAFLLGADFVLTGSVNQCTVEGGTSDKVKSLLQEMDIHDTDYAPAGDMFEIGSKVQVLKKGVLFPSRANKLHSIYHLFNSIEEIPSGLIKTIEEKYFRQSFNDILKETRAYFASRNQLQEVERAESNSKHKMALIIRWYLGKSNQWAIQGVPDRAVDYQIHIGPALGAFNKWVQGTPLAQWQNRHVDAIAKVLLDSAVEIINKKVKMFS